MATLASLLFKPVSTGIKIGKAALVGSAPTQIAIGAGVGAITGAAQGWDINSAIEGAGKGALLGTIGAGMFAGAQRSALPVGKAAGNWLFKQGGARKLGVAGFNVTKNVGRGALGVTKFAANHPLLSGATVGTVLVGPSVMDSVSNGYVQTFQSPTIEGAEVNTRYDQQVIAAAELGQIGTGAVGSAPEMRQSFEYANWMQQVGSMVRESPAGRMAQSATGLVQGLHAGRHS